MRTTVALLAPIALAACCLSACSGDHSNAAPDPGSWAETFDRGGTHDLSRCQRSGEDVGPSRCVASAGEAGFALAVCGTLQADNTLIVEERSARGQEAVLAVDGTSTTASPLTVRGSFHSFATIDARNTVQVDGSMSTAGDLRAAAPVRVEGNVLVAGALDVRNTFSVGGTLRAPEGAAVGGIEGTIELGAVDVPRLLSCERAADVRALVDAEMANDDNEDSLRPAAARVTQPTEITLGCGRYRLGSLAIDNTLRIHITGQTRLVVDQDLRIAAPTIISLDTEQARLELLVGGRLEVDDTLDIGSPERAAHSWLAVAGEVRVASPMHLYGHLFVPRGAVGGDNTLDIWGSAYVGALRIASPMRMHAGDAVDATGCPFGSQ